MVTVLTSKMGQRPLAQELQDEPADIYGAVPVAHPRTQASGHCHAVCPPSRETGRHRCLEAGHSRQLPIHGTAVWRRQGHRRGCPYGGRACHQCHAPPQAREAGGPRCHHRGLCYAGLPQLLQGSGWDSHPHPHTATPWRTVHQPQGLPLSGSPGLGGQPGPFPGHLCGLAWQLEAGTYIPQREILVGDTTMPLCVIADAAYPLRPWLTHPYTGHLSASQERFNQRLNHARQVVERSFGRLKGRWRCLLTCLDAGPTNIPQIVGACCALQNLVESKGEAFFQGWAVEAGRGDVQPPTAPSRQVDPEGTWVREALWAHFEEAAG
ncbi:uncharacterized protein LOC142010114 [Carettochelys insculpta]|uniref:uncharacterized protein LOC142010114 n=1 Tax=Carettochelys insculpta TaxID=44489 RepID=UPI003EB6AF23